VARATTVLSRVLILTLRVERALEALATAAAGLPSLDGDRTGVELASEIARAYMMHGEYDRAVRAADEAAAAAERLKLVDVLADALVTHGTSLDGLGRVHSSIAYLRGAVALAREHDLSRPQLRGYYNLAFRLLRLYPRAAFEAGMAGAALATKLGMKEFQTSSTTAACAAAFQLGEWDWEEAAAAEFPLDELPAPLKKDLGVSVAELAAFRGRWEIADPLLDEIDGLFRQSTTPQERATIAGFRAEFAFVRGRFEESYEGWMEAVEVEHLLAEWALTNGARSALWAGNVAGAKATLAGMPGAIPGTFLLAIITGMEAGIAAIEGRTEEARTLYGESQEALRALGTVVELGLTDLDLVRFLGPDDPAAAEAADEARAIFTRLGARPFLDRLDSLTQAVQSA
jgi:tetratricopeptide (TPR) repeat protein